MSATLECREVITFLADYLEEQLPADTREAFASHIDGCDSCTAYLATYSETIRICRQLAHFDESVSDAAPAQLIEAILRARNTRGR